MDKKTLRSHFKSIRHCFTQSERSEMSMHIAGRLYESNMYKFSKTVLIYVSVGDEVETEQIIKAALADGKKVAVPKIFGKEMKFIYISSPDELIAGEYNIPTAPDGNEEVTDFSDALCITPCLSVDANLYRLGYGGGFYDRFFASYPQVKSLCLCYDKLLSRSLPHDSCDIAVDYCITERKSFGGAEYA